MSFYFDFVLSNWQSDIIHYFLTSPLFLIAGIYSTTNLKTYEQAKNLFNPANTQSSFEE